MVLACDRTARAALYKQGNSSTVTWHKLTTRSGHDKVRTPERKDKALPPTPPKTPAGELKGDPKLGPNLKHIVGAAIPRREPSTETITVGLLVSDLPVEFHEVAATLTGQATEVAGSDPWHELQGKMYGPQNRKDQSLDEEVADICTMIDMVNSSFALDCKKIRSQGTGGDLYPRL